ncbi:MAG: response regulator [Stellaceae bacterium]
MQKLMRPARGKRILVIEDDANVRTLVLHVLLTAGYAVDAVGSVAEALVLFDRHQYHLVLADDRLPDGRGIDLADDAHKRGIDAVVVTGFALSLAKEELGRHDLLIKPVSPSELVGAVERHIGGVAQAEQS